MTKQQEVRLLMAVADRACAVSRIAVGRIKELGYAAGMERRGKTVVSVLKKTRKP